MKRSPPCPPNTSKIYLPAEHTEYLMNAGRGSETSKKANQSLQNEVGQKIKTKRETNNSGKEIPPGEGVVNEEKFPHNRKPSHRLSQ